MKTLCISKPDRNLSGSVSLPGSKSISNRVLLIRALSGVSFDIANLSEAADTLLMNRLLDEIRETTPRERPVTIDAGNSGTVMRFLTAYLATRKGSWMLTGSARMLERPVGPLVEALRSLNARIEYLSNPGYPPLLIKGTGLRGGSVTINAGVSSQFISALLMTGTQLPGGLTIKLSGKEVSAPYTAMTLRLLQSFGISAERSRKTLRVGEGVPEAKSFLVEADWSAAAFWYEAGAFAENTDLLLKGLDPDSVQGDAILPEIYRNFGIDSHVTPEGIRLTRSASRLNGFYYDFTSHPDLAQAVITTCAGLGLRSRFEGLESLRIKECDRLEGIRHELSKLGFRILLHHPTPEESTIDIVPGRDIPQVQRLISTYGDHRMAMTFAPLCLITGPLQIAEPEVTVKSYPGFWDEMNSLGFLLTAE